MSSAPEQIAILIRIMHLEDRDKEEASREAQKLGMSLAEARAQLSDLLRKPPTHSKRGPAKRPGKGTARDA